MKRPQRVGVDNYTAPNVTKRSATTPRMLT